MKLYFRDYNAALIEELRTRFDAQKEDVEFSCDDIFLGPPVDAIVSPANSFGYMDGGIDRVYCTKLGWQVQDNVQAEIAKRPFKELLIGQAIVAPTGSDLVKWIIAAPTMRLPGVTQQYCVYLAMRAAMYEALTFKAVACPGLGTLTGRVHPTHAAEAMWHGYMDAKVARFLDGQKA